MSGAVGSATMAAAVLSSSLAAVAASSPSSTTTGTTAAAGGQLTAVLVDLSNKDKNFAKLLKNAHVAKELLAPEVKNKKRLATLYAVMEGASEHEHVFFRELHDMLFLVMHEALVTQAEKIQQGGSMSVTSTAVVDYLKILSVFHKILDYMGPELHDGWRHDQIVAVLRKLLCESNHPKIREEGLSLLLKFMTVGPPDDVDIASLYHNAVIASCFVSSAGDVGPIELNYEPIRSPDGLPLLLPESSSSSRSTAGGGGESKQLDDSVVLLRIILQHLHSAISDHNRREQAGLLWNTFKKHYGSTFYPDICRQLHILDASDARGFNKRCPVRFQAEFVPFVHDWFTSTSPNTTKSVQLLFLENDDNLAFLHEVLSQSLSLHTDHARLVNATMILYRHWLGSPLASRPSFMRSTDDSSQEVRTNHFARMYIGHMRNVFNSHSSRTLQVVQMQLFRSVLDVYQALVMGENFKLEPSTWDTLLVNLLEIVDTVMNQKNKFAVVDERQPAKEIVQRLGELVFAVLVRSGISDAALWTRAQTVMQRTTRWEELLEMWTATMFSLTKTLAQVVYSSDLDVITKGFTGRIQSLAVKSPVRKFKRDDSSSVSTSALAQPLFPTTPSPLLNFSSVFAPKFEGKSEPDEAAIKRSQHVLSVWRNMLAIVGNPNAIQSDTIHASAIRCLATVTDMLIAVRDQIMPIPFGTKPVPSLVEFLPWLFQAADMADHYAAGRSLALGAICRILGRWDDVAVEPSASGGATAAAARTPKENEPYLPYFYWLLLKVLDGSDLSLLQVVLNKMPHFFTLCLPGSSLVIPSVVRSFRKLLVERSHLPNAALTDGFKQDIVQFLGGLIGVLQAYDYNGEKQSWTALQVNPNAKTVLPSDVATAASRGSSTTSSSGGDGPLPESLRFDHQHRVFSLDGSGVQHEWVPPSLGGGGTDDSILARTQVAHADLLVQLKEIFVSLLPAVSVSTVLPHSTVQLCVATMSTLGLMATEAVFHPLTDGVTTTSGLVDDALTAAAQCMVSPSLQIITATVDWLRHLAQNFNSMSPAYQEKLSGSTPILQIHHAIISHLTVDASQSKSNKDETVPLLLHAMLDWVMAIPAAKAQAIGAIKSLIEVVELALSNASDAPELATPTPTPMTASAPILPSPGMLFFGQRTTELVRRPSRASSKHSTLSRTMTDQDDSGPSATAGQLRETAIDVLMHLLHHFNNFPSVSGPELMSSLVLETDDTAAVTVPEDVPDTIPSSSTGSEITTPRASPSVIRRAATHEHLTVSVSMPSQSSALSSPALVKLPDSVHYFALGDSTLITVIEIPTNNRSEANSPATSTFGRVIVRNMTGRYAWDARLFYEALHTSPAVDDTLPTKNASPSAKILQLIETFDIMDKVSSHGVGAGPNNGLLSPVLPQTPTLPTLTLESLGVRNDALDQLVQYVSSAVSNDTDGNYRLIRERPYQPPESIAAATADMERKIAATAAMEERVSDKFYRTVSSPSLGTFSFTKAQPQPAPSAVSATQRVRLLLVQLGLLTWESLSIGLPSMTPHNALASLAHLSITMLDRASTKLARAVASLDKQNGREQFKIGVIYVGFGQENQQAMLANDQGSQDYEDFVKGLGWMVDVQTHQGYLGGLEASTKSGSHAPYYATSLLEAIFHVSTMMPTDREDVQLVKKKRHLGNDEVNIIWNEHYRPFDPNAIPSEVTEAYIIVTPLPNKLFGIELNVKREAVKFGPLQHRVVVTKLVLAHVVRVTSINAMRRIRSTASSARVPNPYANRLQLIQDIVNKNKLPNPALDTFMNAIIQAGTTKAS